MTTRRKQDFQIPIELKPLSSMSQVRASHLLVKHQGSRRPASWKDESGAVITKRTKEQVRSNCPLFHTTLEHNWSGS
jgi:hypothetical protein